MYLTTALPSPPAPLHALFVEQEIPCSSSVMTANSASISPADTLILFAIR